MSERKALITLVSLNQAKEGFTFLHKGSAPRCEGCKYSHVCIKNLEPGRVYRVVGTRDKQLRCELAEKDMMVVEVVESEVEASIPSKQAIEGAVIVFQKGECKEEDCPNFEICSPKGLVSGDRSEIVKVIGTLECPRGFPLARVVLRRVQIS